MRDRIFKRACWFAGAIGFAGMAYGIQASATWLRYGHIKNGVGRYQDSFLDEAMPVYEVFERHSVRVSAPREITFAVVSKMDLLDSLVVRTIFKAREMILGSRPKERRLPRPLLAQAKALGWGVLAEIPNREIVFGAVTRPWEAEVVFRSIPHDEFAAFHEAGYVKIVWTLRADPVSATESILRTETRAVTTDSLSRAKFRLYWSAFSPGIILIRKVLLRLAKNEAERCARSLGSQQCAYLSAVGCWQYLANESPRALSALPDRRRSSKLYF